MIVFLQTILLRITAVAILGSVALALTQDSAQQKSLRLVVGVLLALCLLTSLGNLSAPWQAFQQTMGDLDAQIIYETETATKRNQKVEKSSVTGVMIQYMTDRARQLGVAMTASLEMATDDRGILVVHTAHLTTPSRDKDAIAQVQTMLAEECGIAKEKQQWTFQ